MTMVPAHHQQVTHTYVICYPEHSPRRTDPHYTDFNHFHRSTRHLARCFTGLRVGFDQCWDEHGNPAAVNKAGVQAGLELHHAHVEFALQNGISLTALEVDYPGISNPDEVGAWVESAANLRWLCTYHHRGGEGAHTLTHSDWEGAEYIRGLVLKGLVKP